MIKRILFTLTFLIPCVLSSLAQNAPVDIFIGSTNVFSNSWQSGFVTAPASTTSGIPYEGTTHFLFDYNYTGWWGGGQLNINSWSSNSFVDFSKHTHLVIAYKA